MPQQAVASIVDVARGSVEAYNDKNWDRVRATTSPDVFYDEIATNRKARGIDEVLNLWRGWSAAFPDSKATFDHSYVDGNFAILELTWRGTHKGPLQSPRGEIPATGKTIQIRACQVIEVAGDKAKNIRHYFDLTTLLQQLGV